ncbi:hypothetical protein P8452_18823 [Trifolium repens]|nr:hypothetical protein P8452_18823 [Trifolium repens]
MEELVVVATIQKIDEFERKKVESTTKEVVDINQPYKEHDNNYDQPPSKGIIPPNLFCNKFKHKQCSSSSSSRICQVQEHKWSWNKKIDYRVCPK